MKRVALLILILSSVLITNGQTVITDKNITALTKFQTVNNSKDEKYSLCLAKDNTRKKYLLLIEHQIYDYSKDLMDTIGFSIRLDVHKDIKRGPYSWLEQERLLLFPAQEQPKTNTKGRVFAFEISDTLLYDVKKQRLGELILIHTYKNQYNTVTKKDVGLSDIGKNFFINNCSLINLGSVKGSFDDISIYKTKLIPLYSLFKKDTVYINKILGVSIQTNIIKDGLKENTYITDEGKYIITFQHDLVNNINMYPKKKFKYIGKLFIMDKIPFEITNCNCGEYSTKESYHETEDGIVNTFIDKTQHRIMFYKKGRYLEKVVVEIY